MIVLKDVKVGELVRNKFSRECWLVVSKSGSGLSVVNLQLKSSPAFVMMILPSSVDDWDRDIDIDDLEKWEKDGLEQKMRVVEDIEQGAQEDLKEETVDNLSDVLDII